MRVKEVWILVVILLVTIVYAAPNAVVNITPVSLYETTEAAFNLTINNVFGSEVIEEIRVDAPSLTITGVTDFAGWQNNFTENLVTWFDGDIENNAIALFQFNARAKLVDDDETGDIEIITKGDSDEETTDIIEITILNDDTAPLLSNNIPQDGGFVRQGINNQQLSIDAIDDETGIKNASFSYWNCSPNATITITSIELTCAAGTCTSQADLSSYEEGDSMCFEFIVYNNALESETISGTVGFDGTAPSVVLIAPDNGAYGGSSTLFSFNATDNLAPTLECEWIVDDEVIDSATANNAEITDTTYDMSNVSEGNHNWKVRCTDMVGLSADSETRTIIIDKTPPTITLNSPENNSIIGDNVLIDIDVTDNYEVDTVDYSISLNSSELPEGTNILTVTAEDEAGNTAIAEFIFIVDRTAPTINMIAPLDNASSDVHVNFVFDIDDNLDSTLDCSLYLNGSLEESAEFNIADTINWTVIIPRADYDWYIICEDDAGNSDSTGSRLIHVRDVTGPDFVSDIVYVPRTKDYPFDVEVTDPSGVNSVEIIFNNTVLNITNDEDIYSGMIQTDLSYPLGVYYLEITAADELGNPNSMIDEFELVNGYIINLNVEPNEAEEGEEVTVSGTALLDDLSPVPENFATLYLPEDIVNVTIDGGAFNYTFDAEDAGTYTIRAVIVSAEGIEHEAAKILIVLAPEPQPSSDSYGSSSGGLYCGDGTCSSASAANEDCNNCPQDCGACPAEPAEKDILSGGFNETPEEESRTPAGVGSASGLFRRAASNPLAWILMIIIIAALYMMSYKRPGYRRKSRSKVNWTGYFDRLKK
ncbi:hypothetical protein GOV06_05550 [Candidatus Woesearchaeota archaeon]|nr:hypothetical protein [Candidatus Woesearchaeota archaeon]